MPTGNLPAAGKKIWEEVHAIALKGSCKGDEECAARTAWSAVKGAGWHKDKDGQWVHKAELEEFSLTIKNLFIDQKTQEKRWKADTSDTIVDSRGDNMTIDLFKSFLSHVTNNDPAPEDYRSEFWQGGMPYLSVSHYSDFDGKGVPGTVENVYIDGRFFKAKGKFNDTPKGNAAWKALLADKESNRPDKVRISIGFLDYGHIHKSNNYVFKRKSLDEVCPECIREHLNGENSGRSFTDGMLVHLAMTRVPVNKRTSIAPDDEMEVKSDMTTQLEDAKSIIGEEAEELEALKKEFNKKSELVEFSEIDKAVQTCPKCGEDVTPTSDGKCPECGADMESPDEDAQEVTEEACATGKKKKSEVIEEESEVEVDLAVTKKEGDCSHPSSHYLVVEDAKSPSTWHLRVKGCDGQPDHRLMGAAWAALHGGYRGNSYAGPNKAQAISKLTKMYSGEKMDTPTKAELELSELLEEVKEMKSVIQGNEPTRPVIVQEQDEVQKSELYPSIQSLVSKFSEVLKSNLPEEEKLKAIQEPFNNLANVMVEEVKKSVIVVKSTQAEIQPDLVQTLSEALSNAISPVVQKLDMLLQSQAPVDGRIPPRRSLMPSVVVPQILKADQEQEANKNKVKTSYTIAEIANKSVGLQ